MTNIAMQRFHDQKLVTMQSEIKVARRDVAAIVQGTFPHYRGRKIKVAPATKVTLYDLNWSGGTRNQYRSATINGQPAGSADKFNDQAPWENQGEGQSVPIPAGMVLVKHCDFCGHDLGLTIYCNPADMPRYLPR